MIRYARKNNIRITRQVISVLYYTLSLFFTADFAVNQMERRTKRIGLACKDSIVKV